MEILAGILVAIGIVVLVFAIRRMRRREPRETFNPAYTPPSSLSRQISERSYTHRSGYLGPVSSRTDSRDDGGGALLTGVVIGSMLSSGSSHASESHDSGSSSSDSGSSYDSGGSSGGDFGGGGFSSGGEF